MLARAQFFVMNQNVTPNIMEDGNSEKHSEFSGFNTRTPKKLYYIHLIILHNKGLSVPVLYNFYIILFYNKILNFICLLKALMTLMIWNIGKIKAYNYYKAV